MKKKSPYFPENINMNPPGKKIIIIIIHKLAEDIICPTRGSASPLSFFVPPVSPDI